MARARLHWDLPRTLSDLPLCRAHGNYRALHYAAMFGCVVCACCLLLLELVRFGVKSEGSLMAGTGARWSGCSLTAPSWRRATAPKKRRCTLRRRRATGSALVPCSKAGLQLTRRTRAGGRRCSRQSSSTLPQRSPGQSRLACGLEPGVLVTLRGVCFAGTWSSSGRTSTTSTRAGALQWM